MHFLIMLPEGEAMAQQSLYYTHSSRCIPLSHKLVYGAFVVVE